jgi:hypothetical protein
MGRSGTDVRLRPAQGQVRAFSAIRSRRERLRSDMELVREPMVRGCVHRIASWLRRLARSLNAQEMALDTSLALPEWAS